jgi:polyhydroxyalkanoate synthesis regulator phasin
VPPARPRQPSAPAPGQPVVEDPLVRTWEEELADRISSLRNWVALLGVLAVVALGVAVYALIKAEEEDTDGTRARVSQNEFNNLRSRVNDLEENSTSDTSVSQLKSDVSDLSDEVDKLSSANSDADAVSGADFQTLKTQVDQLSQQVEDLQAQPTQ